MSMSFVTPRRRLQSILGLALAVLPSAIAWSPGFPRPAATPGPLAYPAGDPNADAEVERIEIASGAGHVVAAVVGAESRSPTRLVEIGPGMPPRPVRIFQRGATHPTVGTDRAGRVVVVVRTCGLSTGANQADCGLAIVDLASGRSTAMAGSEGARIGAMDRGTMVMARGTRLSVTPAQVGQGTRRTRPTTLPLVPTPDDRWGKGTIEGLAVSGGVIAVTAHYTPDFGGSLVARHDARGGWKLLASARTGGAAIGPRDFYAPQVIDGRVRAFFDGAEDVGSYAAIWGADGKRGTTVKANAATGRPVHLTSGAFDGDRLLAFTIDDACWVSTCAVPSFGPFPTG